MSVSVFGIILYRAWHELFCSAVNCGLQFSKVIRHCTWLYIWLYLPFFFSLPVKISLYESHVLSKQQPPGLKNEANREVPKSAVIWMATWVWLHKWVNSQNAQLYSRNKHVYSLVQNTVLVSTADLLVHDKCAGRNFYISIHLNYNKAWRYVLLRVWLFWVAAVNAKLQALRRLYAIKYTVCLSSKPFEHFFPFNWTWNREQSHILTSSRGRSQKVFECNSHRQRQLSD